MRLLLVALLLSSCAGDCSGVGAVGSMRAGDMQHGAARGAMAVPVDGDDAVDCGDFHSTPAAWLAARKETAFANNDPVETMTDFGSLAQNVTNAVLAGRHTFLDPCESGKMNDLPCFSNDGGDHNKRAIAEAAYKFLHDGTGATILLVYEIDAGGTTRFALGTMGSGNVNNLGYAGYVTGGNAPYVGTGTSNVIPATGTATVNGTTYVGTHRHAELGATDYRKGINGAEGTTGGYVNTPSTSNPSTAFTIGAGGGGPNAFLLGEIYELVLFDDYASDAELAADYAVLECVYGSFPQ